MFGSDYNKKGVAVSYTVSITLHIIVLLLFLFFQNKHRKALADYTLTEINIIEEVPDQQQPKPVQIEKPKGMLDILKQVIPIKQKASIEIAKPKTLEIEKPKIDLKKIIQVGNAAAVGAKMVLVSKSLRAKAEEIAKKVNYLELTVFPTFTDNFVKSTLFPEKSY